MVRRFQADRPVPISMRDRLLCAAGRAPSAGFTQGTEYLALDADADRDRFWNATRTDRSGPEDSWLTGMRTAPLLVVCWSNKQAYQDRYGRVDKGWQRPIERRWPVPYWDIDAGFGALLMLLDAVDQQLGACFFGVPPDRVTALRKAFAVPGEFTPVGVVAVGFPAPGARAQQSRTRRDANDVIHLGRW